MCSRVMPKSAIMVRPERRGLVRLRAAGRSMKANGSSVTRALLAGRRASGSGSRAASTPRLLATMTRCVCPARLVGHCWPAMSMERCKARSVRWKPAHVIELALGWLVAGVLTMERLIVRSASRAFVQRCTDSSHARTAAIRSRRMRSRAAHPSLSATATRSTSVYLTDRPISRGEILLEDGQSAVFAWSAG